MLPRGSLLRMQQAGNCAEQTLAWLRRVAHYRLKGNETAIAWRTMSIMTASDCDFYCGKILQGLLPVPVYCENELVFAFHHTRPLWENHVVHLPRKHIASLLDLEESDNDLLLELMRTAKIIAADFMARCGACRVYTNLGDYQSSKHLHWHIGCGRQLRPY
jgi:histidine triad (HIT) family protein